MARIRDEERGKQTVSTQEQEAYALDRAWRFLLDLSSGDYRVEGIKKLRQDARDIARHYPLAAGTRWKGGR